MFLCPLLAYLLGEWERLCVELSLEVWGWSSCSACSTIPRVDLTVQEVAVVTSHWGFLAGWTLCIQLMLVFGPFLPTETYLLILLANEEGNGPFEASSVHPAQHGCTRRLPAEAPHGSGSCPRPPAT